MNEPTMETLARRLDRVERENRRLRRLGGLTFSLGLLFPVVLFAACDNEAPYRGQSLGVTSMESVNIVCESDLVGTTGYYAEKDGTTLVSWLKKQSKRDVWIISVTGDEATVGDGQGNVRRFQVANRKSSGLVLVDVSMETAPQVISIDPQNSSFVYSSQNVTPVWNRINVWVGRCRLGEA